MKTKNKIENFSHFMLILNYLLLILFALLIKAENDENIVKNNNNDIVENVKFIKKEKILSRRRRYLIFPEGTSLQIVADSHHPIVDYDNLFFVGITLAMAWELPSQPTYLTEFQELYEDGQLPLLDRNDGNVTDSNVQNSTTNTTNRIKDEDKYYHYSHSHSNNQNNHYNKPYYNSHTGNNNNYNIRKKDSYYYNNNNNYVHNRQPTTNKQNYYFNTKPSDKLLDQINTFATQNYKPWATTDWGKLSNRLSEVLKHKQYNQYYSTLNANQRNEIRKHVVLPMFGKRSTDEHDEKINGKLLTKEEKAFRKHHRLTRYKLYRQIEKFLKKKGKDGHECILRMLCETGQKRRQQKPSSFLIELARAVFSLPVDLNESKQHPVHRLYDEAHEMNENCKETFPKCKESMWDKDFQI